MSPPFIIDAGPALNFFATNQERVLLGVVGRVNMPETVQVEVLNKARSDRRFTAAATVLGKLSDERLHVLPDTATAQLGQAVQRICGQPIDERLLSPRDLGETMVIAHAVVMAEAGATVFVLIDEGDGARVAQREAARLLRLRDRGHTVGDLALINTYTILERAVSNGLISDRTDMRRRYERMHVCDDGLLPIENTGLLQKRVWQPQH